MWGLPSSYHQLVNLLNDRFFHNFLPLNKRAWRRVQQLREAGSAKWTVCISMSKYAGYMVTDPFSTCGEALILSGLIVEPPSTIVVHLHRNARASIL